MNKLEPKGFNIVIDATGARAVLQDCFKYLQKGAKLIVYGVCGASEQICFSPYDLFSNEYQIIGSFAQVNCFDRAIAALEHGIVKVDKLITNTFELKNYDMALETVIQGKSSLKVMIHPAGK